MKPKAYRVVRNIRETPESFSLQLKGKLHGLPGQFVMLWLPNVDEKPFAVAYQLEDTFFVTIEEKGTATQAMAGLKEGDNVGIRGPYGYGFSNKDKSVIVAGGLGMASVLQLALVLNNTTIIQGARTKDLLLYKDNEKIQSIIAQKQNKIIYCTDDGTLGEKSFTTEILEKEIQREKPSCVYTCGPEIMMARIFEICETAGVPAELAIERYMKCGIGLCGSCCINDQLVCKDGPVFNSEKVRRLTELGKFARLPTGKKVDLKTYHNYRS